LVFDTSSFKTYDGRWNIPTADLTVTTNSLSQLLGAGVGVRRGRHVAVDARNGHRRGAEVRR